MTRLNTRQPKTGAKLLKQLNKIYAPAQLIRFTFGRYDVAAKTDDEGYPILLFIGRANEQGITQGDQFVRRLLKNATGAVLKDHWDYNGKV